MNSIKLNFNIFKLKVIMIFFHNENNNIWVKHPVQYKTWSFRQFITFWREELSKEWGHITHKRTCMYVHTLALTHPTSEEDACLFSHKVRRKQEHSRCSKGRGWQPRNHGGVRWIIGCSLESWFDKVRGWNFWNWAIFQVY